MGSKGLHLLEDEEGVVGVESCDGGHGLELLVAVRLRDTRRTLLIGTKHQHLGRGVMHHRKGSLVHRN
jgi:hypothetical protein